MWKLEIVNVCEVFMLVSLQCKLMAVLLLRFWIFMKSLHGINLNAMVCQKREVIHR